MRFAVLLMLAAGACGRIGIDPLADARSPTLPDAAPVTCTLDGTPCDDGNICTPTSTCSAGVCKPDGDAPTTACTVARSDTEYATQQGAGGWYYGFYNATADTDGTYDATVDFESAALFPGELWRPPSFEEEPSSNFTWAYLAAWGGHPGSFPAYRASIRRWVSDVTGAATVLVSASKADLGGDGVKIILVVDGTVAFSRSLAGTDGTGFEDSIAVDLVIGTTIDLLLDANVADGVDTTTQTLRITSR